jgi:hypothetical protein
LETFCRIELLGRKNCSCRKAAEKMSRSNKYLQNIYVITAGCLRQVLPQADNGKDYPTTRIDTIATVPRMHSVCVTRGKKYLIRNSIAYW